jgi:hypothetical protein
VNARQRRWLERLEAERNGPPLTTEQAVARLRQDALALIRPTEEPGREREAAEHEERLVAIIRSRVFAAPPRCYRNHGEGERCERCQDWAARATQVAASRLDEHHWAPDVRGYFERRRWPIPTEMRTLLDEAETARRRKVDALRENALRLIRPSPE